VQRRYAPIEHFDTWPITVTVCAADWQVASSTTHILCSSDEIRRSELIMVSLEDSLFDKSSIWIVISLELWNGKCWEKTDQKFLSFFLNCSPASINLDFVTLCLWFIGKINSKCRLVLSCTTQRWLSWFHVYYKIWYRLSQIVVVQKVELMRQVCELRK
jgi:hypothetical protein